MNILQSTLSTLRDHYSFISHTSNFRSTGQISPDEFVLAGDYLVYKFPTWSWADASPESKRVSYLPPGKQYLVTRGVPCHRRLDDNFAGDAGGVADDLVQDGFLGVDDKDGGGGAGGGGGGGAGGGDGEDDGWLRTGGSSEKEQAANIREVQTMSESGNLGEKGADDDEDEIPDMEDDDDDNEAIIRDPKAGGTKAPLRTYNLYITYFPYYRTPRLYLSGYLSASEPVPPAAMMDDIVGDYKDKTVTLETFPFFDGGVKMASVHPCKHASVMKVLLDRADAALKLRLLKMRQSEAAGGNGAAPARHTVSGMEGLIDDTSNLGLTDKKKREKREEKSKKTPTAHAQGVAAAGGAGGDEWEVLDQEEGEAEAEAEAEGEDKSAIRVDQYLVVFLKFAASVTPTIEYDFTMGL